MLVHKYYILLLQFKLLVSYSINPFVAGRRGDLGCCNLLLGGRTRWHHLQRPTNYSSKPALLPYRYDASMSEHTVQCPASSLLSMMPSFWLFLLGHQTFSKLGTAVWRLSSFRWESGHFSSKIGTASRPSASASSSAWSFSRSATSSSPGWDCHW